MTSEARERVVGQDAGAAPSAKSQPLVRVGLRAAVALALVGLSFAVAALIVHAASSALFGGSQGLIDTGSAGTTSGQQSLVVQRAFVEERRSAIAAYAVTVADFKLTASRHPDALGLDAREASRRDVVLAGLVLDCINAVDQYNLGASTVPAAQLQRAGLPERFVWADDCAAGQ